MFRTGHGRNDYGYSNSTYDALLDQIGTERVRARRERLMFEAERMIMTDAVILPVYTYVTKRLVSPQLRGWQNNVMDHHPTRHMFKLRLRGEAPTRSAAPAVEAAAAEAVAETLDAGSEAGSTDQEPAENPAEEPVPTTAADEDGT